MTNNNVETNSRVRHHPALLWAALVVSALCNAATSFTGAGTAVNIVFGVLTLLFGLGLVLHYRRR